MASLQLTMYLTIVSSDVLSGILSRLESESAHDNRAHDNRLDSRQTRCCDQTQLETPDSTCSLAFGHLRNSSGTLQDLGFTSRADSTSLTRIDNMAMLVWPSLQFKHSWTRSSLVRRV